MNPARRFVFFVTILSIAVLAGVEVLRAQDNVTMTTYYPSPRGVYREVRVFEDTLMAYNPTVGSNVSIGTDTFAATDKLTIMGEGNTAATAALNIINSASAPMMFMRNDGTTGIGTITPAARLDVLDNIQITGSGTSGTLQSASGQSLIVRQQGAGGVLNLDANATNGSIAFRSDTTDRMVFYPPTGRLVIGDRVDATTSKLLVHSPDSNASCAKFTNNTTGTAATDGLDVCINAAEEAEINMHEAAPLKLFTSNLERMRIDAAGNVGIRDAAPDALLEVNGDGVEDNGNEVVVTTLGRVGIGTTAPNAGLQVLGAADPASFVHIGSSVANQNIGMRLIGAGVNKWAIFNEGANNDYLWVVNSAKQGLRMTQADGAGYFTGNLTVAANATALAFFYASDARLKDNITLLDEEVSLEKVLQLEGVSFDWKSDGRSSLGFVAQDVQKVFPELVSENDEGYLSVEYANLIAPLTQAIKAQQKQIDSLKEEVSELRQQLELE